MEWSLQKKLLKRYSCHEPVSALKKPNGHCWIFLIKNLINFLLATVVKSVLQVLEHSKSTTSRTANLTASISTATSTSGTAKIKLELKSDKKFAIVFYYKNSYGLPSGPVPSHCTVSVLPVLDEDQEFHCCNWRSVVELHEFQFDQFRELIAGTF